MTEYEKQRIDEDLASMLEYYSQPKPEPTGDGNTGSNLLFGGLFVAVAMAGGGA